MNLQQLRVRVRDLLQEPDEHGRFTNEALNRYINDGILDVADRVECLVATVSLPVDMDGTTLLPDDFLRARRVAVGSQRIHPTTSLYLDREAQVKGVNWVEQIGTPTHFYIEGETISLYPKPTATVDVALTYVQAPSPMVADEDESPLPSWLNPLVVMYAVAEAWKSDEDGRVALQLQEYEAKLEAARRRWDARQPNGRTRIRLGR